MKRRIAFVKFGGLAAGGTERWMQEMAAGLPADRFAVDFFFCDTAPYIGSDFEHPDTDPARLRFMEDSGVNLMRFHVAAKDVSRRMHPWVGTDFWNVFDESRYDLIQVASAGPADYPAPLFQVPVVEFIALAAGVNFSPNVAWSIHLSQWQRANWVGRGGRADRSSVIPIPAIVDHTARAVREELGIPPQACLAGFHQRAQDEIFSPIPLSAFSAVAGPDDHFCIMGGGTKYREQAADLGTPNIHFIEHSGELSRVSGFLRSLDVFAHGRADGETFGAVFAEAMILGKPCLSHRTDIANAQPETFGPGGDFANGEGEYAALLDRLLHDRTYRESVGDLARTHAKTYFELERCVDQLERVYERVLGEHGRRVNRPEPLPYGESPPGFLIAGDLADQEDPASSVLTGRYPYGTTGRVLTRLADEHPVALVLGQEALPLVPMLLAAGCAVIIDHPLEPVAAVSETISLNRWRRRVAYEVDPSATIRGLGAKELLVVSAGPLPEPVENTLLSRGDELDARVLRTHQIGRWTVILIGAPERHGPRRWTARRQEALDAALYSLRRTRRAARRLVGQALWRRGLPRARPTATRVHASDHPC